MLQLQNFASNFDDIFLFLPRFFSPTSYIYVFTYVSYDMIELTLTGFKSNLYDWVKPLPLRRCE